MHIAGFIPQSFSDWPAHTVSVIFTAGCNFRCSFCQNGQLIDRYLPPKSIEHIIGQIKKIAWAIDGVCITGGEPTLQPDLGRFCQRIKKMALKVKLDTNGSRPDVLDDLISKGLIDYVAMDVKCPLEKYPQITTFEHTDKITQSIRTIIESGLPHEFRTTYVPALLTPHDVHQITKLIDGAKRYVLQRFEPKNAHDPKLRSTRSPTHDELLQIARALDFKGEIRIRAERGEVCVRS